MKEIRSSLSSSFDMRTNLPKDMQSFARRTPQESAWRARQFAAEPGAREIKITTADAKGAKGCWMAVLGAACVDLEKAVRVR